MPEAIRQYHKFTFATPTEAQAFYMPVFDHADSPEGIGGFASGNRITIMTGAPLEKPVTVFLSPGALQVAKRYLPAAALVGMETVARSDLPSGLSLIVGDQGDLR